MSSMPPRQLRVSRNWRGGSSSRAHWLLDGTLSIPGLLVFAALVIFPTLACLAYSFTNYNYLYPDTSWVGLTNYVRLLGDEQFLQAAATTFKMTAVLVLVPNLGGLLIALLLNKNRPLYHATRAVLFTPMTLSAVVVSFIWLSILSDNGVINTALDSLGLGGFARSWLGNPSLAPLSVAIVVSWQMLGFCVVVYLAGLQGVPHDLQDAAKVDGAGPIKVFHYVTWPMIAPAVTVNSVVLTITGLKMYDYVVVLTNGGPGGATETLGTTVIKTSFQDSRIGYASTMAICLMAVIAVVSLTMLFLLQRREIDQ